MLGSFGALPTNLAGSSKYDWMKPKAADFGAGKIEAASQVAKLKRPGKNSGRTDTVVMNKTEGVGANALKIQTPAEFGKFKHPGKNASRLDIGYTTTKRNSDGNTDMSIQSRHVHTDVSELVLEQSQFPVHGSDAMDTDTDRAAEDAFDQDMDNALLDGLNGDNGASQGLGDIQMSYYAEEESEEE